MAAAGAVALNQVRIGTDDSSPLTARAFRESLGRVAVFRHVPVSHGSPEPIGLIQCLHRNLKGAYLAGGDETAAQARGELTGYVEFCNRRRESLSVRHDSADPGQFVFPNDRLAVPGFATHILAAIIAGAGAGLSVARLPGGHGSPG